MDQLCDQDPLGARDPFTTGLLFGLVVETLVPPFDDMVAVEEAFKFHGSDIAAVILEPVAHVTTKPSGQFGGGWSSVVS